MKAMANTFLCSWSAAPCRRPRSENRNSKIASSFEFRVSNFVSADHRCPFLCEVAFGHIEKFEREVINHGAEFLNALHKLVVGNQGGDSGEQTRGSGYQCFGNSGRDASERSCPCGPEAVKRVNDAPDGPEKADKRRYGGRGGQPSQPTFHVG